MFTEDLSAFFREFGSDAVLDGHPVRGIFDNAAALGSVGLVGMAGTQPVFTLPTSSIVGEPVGQTLVRASVTYVIEAHEPDGTGISRLFLEVSA